MQKNILHDYVERESIKIPVDTLLQGRIQRKIFLTHSSPFFMMKKLALTSLASTVAVLSFGFFAPVSFAKATDAVRNVQERVHAVVTRPFRTLHTPAVDENLLPVVQDSSADEQQELIETGSGARSATEESLDEDDVASDVIESEDSGSLLFVDDDESSDGEDDMSDEQDDGDEIEDAMDDGEGEIEDEIEDEAEDEMDDGEDDDSDDDERGSR